jgi:hypothetical protein
MIDSRVDFELFAKEYNLTLTNGGLYVDIIVRRMLEAWQASRAALKVELPPEHEQAYCAYDGAELRYMLKQAGIRYE